MKVFERLCIKDYTLKTPEGDDFTIKKGKKYTTSAVDTAMAAHGPKPMEGRVVVFTKYWCSVPVEIFE